MHVARMSAEGIVVEGCGWKAIALFGAHPCYGFGVVIVQRIRALTTVEGASPVCIRLEGSFYIQLFRKALLAVG